MGDDWKPGDLAMMVVAGQIRCPNCRRRHTGKHNPPHCSIRTVQSVGYCTDDYNARQRARYGDCFVAGLTFTDGTRGFSPRFRKIRPHTPDAEDRETIALLNGTPAPPAPPKPVEVGK